MATTKSKTAGPKVRVRRYIIDVLSYFIFTTTAQYCVCITVDTAFIYLSASCFPLPSLVNKTLRYHPLEVAARSCTLQWTRCPFLTKNRGFGVSGAKFSPQLLHTRLPEQGWWVQRNHTIRQKQRWDSWDHEWKSQKILFTKITGLILVMTIIAKLNFVF